ncbi:hypothetical protein ACE38W_14110 [Chitinophaga sp. Hz27]|uniref:hypothetical protein n=1 Tax=Chitinophaga sp. Hz27 TaxID=3347169 RepID=UPI0035DA4DF0
MSAQIWIYGIKQEQLLSNLPDSFAAIKDKYHDGKTQLSVKDIYDIFYSNNLPENAELSDYGPEELFFNGIKRYCYLYNVLVVYYFCNFDWEEEIRPQGYDCSFIWDRLQVKGLADWFLAIYKVMNQEDTEHTRYREQARRIVNEYASDIYDGETFKDVFSWCDYSFELLKAGADKGDFDFFFYSYSF